MTLRDLSRLSPQRNPENHLKLICLELPASGALRAFPTFVRNDASIPEGFAAAIRRPRRCPCALKFVLCNKNVLQANGFCRKLN